MEWYDWTLVGLIVMALIVGQWCKWQNRPDRHGRVNNNYRHME